MESKESNILRENMESKESKESNISAISKADFLLFPVFKKSPVGRVL